MGSLLDNLYLLENIESESLDWSLPKHQIHQYAPIKSLRYTIVEILSMKILKLFVILILKIDESWAGDFSGTNFFEL